MKRPSGFDLFRGAMIALYASWALTGIVQLILWLAR
jgi:hypothetical protein